MKRWSLAIVGFVPLQVVPMAVSAQTCGFVWTVTAAPAGRSYVAVTMCGRWVEGCNPHDPHYTVQGSHINITLQASEPPDGCMCLADPSSYQATLLVEPLVAGTNTVTVTVLSCNPPVEVGSTTFDFTPPIPIMNWQGEVAAIAILAVLGVAILARRS